MFETPEHRLRALELQVEVLSNVVRHLQYGLGYTIVVCSAGFAAIAFAYTR